MIFRYLGFRDLTQVRLTCHRWKAVVDGSIYLMDEFVLHFPKGVTMDQDYEPDCLLTASGVSISKACIVTVGPWWTALGEKLVEIVLYNCSIALPELANMLRQTPNLQFLYIENLSCPETGDVPKLANFQLPRLEMFDLFDVDPSLLDLMLRVCTRLKHLGYDYYKTSVGQSETKKIVEYLERFKNRVNEISLILSEGMLSALCYLEGLNLSRVLFECDVCFEQVVSIFQRHQNIQSVQLTKIRLTNLVI